MGPRPEAALVFPFLLPVGGGVPESSIRLVLLHYRSRNNSSAIAPGSAVLRATTMISVSPRSMILLPQFPAVPPQMFSTDIPASRKRRESSVGTKARCRRLGHRPGRATRRLLHKDRRRRRNFLESENWVASEWTHSTRMPEASAASAAMASISADRSSPVTA